MLWGWRRERPATVRSCLINAFLCTVMTDGLGESGGACLVGGVGGWRGGSPITYRKWQQEKKERKKKTDIFFFFSTFIILF